MPTKTLPASPSLDHLKHQADDILRAHAAADPEALQRLREFSPKFKGKSDTEIADGVLKRSEALLFVAREYGFASWARLRAYVENPNREDFRLPMHERIGDLEFRKAVELLDAGDLGGLRAHLQSHPQLTRTKVLLEGGNYFRNPSLLEFAAENPVRHGKLPPNIVQMAKLVLELGGKEDVASVDSALGLVCSGRVPREYGVQRPLIELLASYGADPNKAMMPALAHGEFEAVEALIGCGALINLPAAAALGKTADAKRLQPKAEPEERHLALAYAAQFGRSEILKLLLNSGEEPSRYNPVGAHSHSTPLHQAVCGGHLESVKLLLDFGARLDLKDTLWQGTPLDWAEYGKKREVAAILRARTMPRPSP